METDRVRELMGCAAREEALRILEESGKQQAIMDYGMSRIEYYHEKRAKGKCGWTAFYMQTDSMN